MVEAKEVGLQTDLNRIIAVLTSYYTMEPSIRRIQGLVEDNPEFFNAGWGEDLMARAADKLEELVLAWKIL